MGLNQGFVHREQVGADGSGVPLVTHLADRHPQAGPELWRERIHEGLVQLEGAPALPEAILRAGQWITWARPPWIEPEVPLATARRSWSS